MADNDFVRLNLTIGSVNIPLNKVGLSWPPPERLIMVEGDVVREATDDDDPELVLTRIRMSEIPDDVAAGSDRVARGAEYRYGR